MDRFRDGPEGEGEGGGDAPRGHHHHHQRTVERVRRDSAHVSVILPFSVDLVSEHINLQDMTFLELLPHSKAYGLACDFIASSGRVSSLRYEQGLRPSESDDEDDRPLRPGGASLGLGFFSFNWKQHLLHALHHVVGNPVGGQCGATIYTSLILFAPHSAAVLVDFCNELIAISERSREGHLSVFEWEAASEYWATRVKCPARPLHSVVMNESVIKPLVKDLEEFLCPETRDWYQDHGIPHRRGYLFHGLPGTGKTSLIQALAGHFRHNLCYIHLANPRLTDESLRAAVNQAPRRAILVLEDVDAVFGKHREKLSRESPLSFSGLLNALDGVGRADGQVFILTTNHRDRLNRALVRNGRADVHVEFTFASDEQIAGMFRHFYPRSPEALASSFVSRLRKELRGRPLTCAVLQHFFILHRKTPAEGAVEHVEDVVRELEIRTDEQRLLSEESSRKSRL